MIQHYGFFYSDSNDVFHSVQGVGFLSSTSTIHKNQGAIKGAGTYMYPNNIRHCIALFCVRSLPKHSWVNDPNVYIGEPKI